MLIFLTHANVKSFAFLPFSSSATRVNFSDLQLTKQKSDSTFKFKTRNRKKASPSENNKSNGTID